MLSVDHAAYCYRSVCVSTTRLRFAKTAEWIEVLFGEEALCIGWRLRSQYGEMRGVDAVFHKLLWRLTISLCV